MDRLKATKRLGTSLGKVFEIHWAWGPALSHQARKKTRIELRAQLAGPSDTRDGPAGRELFGLGKAGFNPRRVAYDERGEMGAAQDTIHRLLSLLRSAPLFTFVQEVALRVDPILQRIYGLGGKRRPNRPGSPV